MMSLSFRAFAVLTSLFVVQFVSAQQPPPPPPGLTGEAALKAAVAGLEKTQLALPGLSQALRTLQANLKVTDSVKAQVDKLAAEATSLQTVGNGGEARRRLLHAIAVQRGLPWDERAEFGGSLVLRTNMTVTDSSRPFFALLLRILQRRTGYCGI
jgi:hypothetical protein